MPEENQLNNRKKKSSNSQYGENLTFHTQFHKEKGSCIEVGKMFSNQSNTYRYSSIHIKEKQLECLEHGKNNDLNLHQNIEVEKSYKCSECGKTFDENSTFNTHKTIQVVEKSHKCTECRNRFYTSNDATVHKKSHTGKKPYKCTDCGKSLATSGSLTAP
ncbi:oocyte zinc finger protein XlCOF19-like [Pituophis catenifer annectens]|uniref:oocyte zinc finger protein XlCOF19-like n=1 Tax=Pituophis catenifer annectens TaxID=94852 RepID=UPI003993AEE2